MSRAGSTTEAGGPRILALGSGSGGAGRSTLALEFARALGRRGVRTVVVDCSLTSPVLAPVLGRSPEPAVAVADLLTQACHLADFVSREPGDPVAVLTLTRVAEALSGLQEADAERFLARLRRLECDLVLLDLPPGPLPFWLDLLALVDAPIIVTGPEAWSVRATVPYIQALRGRVRELELAGHARTYLVLNGCRDAAERELGEVLCHAIWRQVGHYPRYLGPIDHDDRRWFHLRHGDSCPPLSGMAGLGVQVEEVVKRVLALEEFDSSRPRGEEQGAHGAGWMGMSLSASPSDLRAQYRRLWEGYRRDSAVSQVLFDADERAAIIDELERTYRALQMALDERRPAPAVATPPAVPAVEPEPEPSAAEPDPVAEPLVVVEHCGELLAARRHAESLSLRELSLRTRIGLRYLEAIETMEVDALPPPVYLRGYLREIARALGLPVDSLLDRYLSELARERERAESGLGAG